MTTATTPEEVRALADACASDWHAVRPHLVVDALHCLQADNEAMRETLEFVERWAVHHASKPHMTAELALGSIQHHPEIRAITERYADGKRPDTFDPYARIAELEGKVGRFQGVPLPLIEAINAATGSNDWQGDHSPAELLEPACRAITALVERKNACIHKLEMDALDLASENSILKRQEQEELEARKPLPLSYRAGAMTSSVDGGATVSLHFNDMAEAEAWFVAITDQHDAALTSKATGPLPGSTGGSS